MRAGGILDFLLRRGGVKGPPDAPSDSLSSRAGRRRRGPPSESFTPSAILTRLRRGGPFCTPSSVTRDVDA